MASANEMTFEVGKDVNGFNVPFVSVTICAPGTRDCRTIDRIKLDTGSDGLRILRTALHGLRLPELKNSYGQHVALCAEMAGGTGYWGPIAKADLVLGDERAPSARVQIVDPEFPKDAETCKAFPTDGRNGILGMGALSGLTQNGQTYFACSSGRCSIMFPGQHQRPRNPVAYMGRNGNGFVITSPPISPNGQVYAKGTIAFGIGTAANNRVDPGELQTCRTNEGGYLKIDYKGQKFDSMIDTGSNSYNLPKRAERIPNCLNSPYLCPRREMSLPIAVLNPDGTRCASVSIPVRSYSHSGGGFADTDWVKPDLVSNYGDLLDDMLTLGMPFFFGRKVYFGIAKRTSPLGAGPLTAFSTRSD